MKKGDEVRIIMPNLVGVVTKVEWDEDADEKRLRVDFSGSEGTVSEKWVRESNLESIS